MVPLAVNRWSLVVVVQELLPLMELVSKNELCHKSLVVRKPVFGVSDQV